MTSNTKLDEKLEGADNFRAWKYGIMLILEGNDIDKYLEGEVEEPEEEEAKVRHKKEMIRAKRIIVDSIKDRSIPKVSSLKTPKEVFDTLTCLFEGEDINRNMTLRSQLKNVNMQDDIQHQAWWEAWGSW